MDRYEEPLVLNFSSQFVLVETINLQILSAIRNLDYNRTKQYDPTIYSIDNRKKKVFVVAKRRHFTYCLYNEPMVHHPYSLLLLQNSKHLSAQ